MESPLKSQALALLLLFAWPATVPAQPLPPASPAPRPVLSIPTLPPPVPKAIDAPAPGTVLSLPRAVQLAFEHNTDILATQLAIAQAQAQLHLAEVAWYPSASVNLSGQEGASGSGQGFGAGTESNSGALTVRQTFSDFGRTRAAIRSSQASLLSAQANLLKKQEDVALLVAQQYYTAIADEELARIASDSVHDQAKHLEQTQAFHEAGLKAGLDVAQAEASLANAQLGLVAANNARDEAYVTLNNAMGFDSDKAYQLDEALIERVPSDDTAPHAPGLSPPAGAVGPVEAAYRDRPDLMSVDAQLMAADASLQLARLGLTPTLSSDGTLTLLDANGQNTPAWNVGLILSVPILDSNATKFTIELNQANVDTLLAQRLSLRHSIYQQVKIDELAILQARSSIEVAHRVVTAAAQAFSLADERYKVGVGSSLDYLDAQLVYVQSRSTLVSAEASLQEAVAQLNHDIGNRESLRAAEDAAPQAPREVH